MIARQRELQRLDSCLASARSGHAAIALLRGEAGMGKSRLAESLAEQARGAGMFVATGHCTPVSGGELPFGPFVEILSQIDTAPGGSERVAGTTWDLLRTALTVSGSSPGVAPPDVGLARSRLFTSVLWLLHQLGQQQPVVLVLEDVHWADASSLDLLNYLARTAARERLMLLLTCRDDGLARDRGTRKAIRDLGRADLTRDIHLKPLTGEQIGELLATAGCELAEERHDRVVQLADGNPFMALELAAHDGAEGTHTEALRHALLGPVDELPDGARSTLHVAAVLGESVSQEVLEKAVQSTGGDVGADLRVLTENGLLVASEEHYDFRHAIVRESVVREMLHGERTAAHRAAAEGVRLSQLGGTPAGLAQLAHHLVAAEEYPAALPVVMSAAESARRVYAFAEARRQLSVARSVLWSRVEDPVGLSGVSSDELVRREAEMARWAGEPSAAADLLRSGLSSTPRAELAQSRLELELGEALWAAGDPAGALAACERAETALGQRPGAAAPGAGPSVQVLRVRVLAALAQALNVTGNYERGQQTAEHAIALARVRSHPDRLAGAHHPCHGDCPSGRSRHRGRRAAPVPRGGVVRRCVQGRGPLLREPRLPPLRGGPAAPGAPGGRGGRAHLPSFRAAAARGTHVRGELGLRPGRDRALGRGRREGSGAGATVGCRGHGADPAPPARPRRCGSW